MSELIYGFHPVREALRHRPHQVVRVLAGEGRRGERRQGIADLCERHGIRLELVREEELNRLSRGVHNGFVAELAEDSAPANASGGRDRELVVLIEDVQDPRNLGAILRTCEGAGVGKILIRDRGAAPISPAVVKTAAGATEWLDIERVVNSAATIGQLKKDGFWVYGTDPAGKPPWQIDLGGKVVLCFGGEAKGLRPRTRKICDELIGLPMRGAVESLNVSAAASAVLFEAVRQRLANHPLPPAGDSG
jgi:23S rRNA (guanosine2251-2'-O)-methyltransferase